MVATRSLTSLALLCAAAAALLAPAARALRLRHHLADDDALQRIESGTTWRRRELATGLPSWSWSSGRSLSFGGPRRRQSAAFGDIPVFDRNRVSLDVGSLYGLSVTPLMRISKIIGDFIQNLAVRYQTFLRLFRPLFRGPFEIKGLDPPTTTTTTTTTTITARTTTTPDSAADNEVRRR